MFTRIALLLLTVTALMTLPVDAQRGLRSGPRGGWEGHRSPDVAGVAMFSPGFLIRAQDRLELSEPQIEQLTALRTEAATASSQASAVLATHRAQLREALTANEPHANAVRQHLEASQEVRTRLEWIGLDTMLKARAVLTQEQRDAVRGMMAERGPRRGGTRGGRRR